MPQGLKALASEKEGVEVLVAGMLLCAREKLDFAAARGALQALADAEPALLKRINMANGKKWLAGPDGAGAGEGGAGPSGGEVEPVDGKAGEAEEVEAATGA